MTDITKLPATWPLGLGDAALMALLQTPDGAACRAMIVDEMKRRAAEPLVRGGMVMPYDYIARFYGKTFKPGDRVSFSEYNGAPGTVRRVRGDPQYVSVKFDTGRVGDCHPDSLTVITPKGQTL